jgi:hypothetical protein
VFFELHERAEKILRMYESDALAVHVVLRCAVAEGLRALCRECPRSDIDAVDLETEVMDAAFGILLEELRDRRESWREGSMSSICALPRST